MQLAVESWAPEYGAPTDEAALRDSDVAVQADAEVPAAEWAPRRPPPSTPVPPMVCFVDGVRRVDARVWITDDAGATRQGLCASYAAGVVACDGTATLAAAEVRRALISPVGGAPDLDTRHGRYRSTPATSDDPDRLAVELQGRMADLERLVSEQVAAGSPGEVPARSSGVATLLVLDGPLRRRHLPGAVGFVKTHQRAYLPDRLAAVVADLDAGERTPAFLVGDAFGRWSWYLRLPCERAHPWAGIVRCEADRDLDVRAAADLADLTARVLPGYASAAHKDPRAPQNLYPIAGLERALARRLGDRELLVRALRRSADGFGSAAPGPGADPGVIAAARR